MDDRNRASASRRWTMILLAGLGTAGVACSATLDSSTAQCRTDSDCARFQAICEPRAHVCVRVDGAKVSPAANLEAVDAGGTPEDVGPDGGDRYALWPCGRPNKPIERITTDVTTSRRLGCERDYLLVGAIAVKAGAVLTIDPGTTVLGDVGSKSRLAIERGAQLIANGLRMAPIVFTSGAAPGMRRAGDWAGVVLLGRATSAVTAIDSVGLRAGDEFGGNDDGESSGVLRFVRIEYAGASAGIAAGAGALTFGAVGRGTVVNSVQVRQSSQDCFKFIGGTVGAKHLVCQGSLRNGFTWESGYRGKAQFLVLQQLPQSLDGANGLLVRNGAPGVGDRPITEPAIYNATLCGRAADVPGEQYGLMVSGGAQAHLTNALMAGFEAGIDVRGANSLADLRNNMFWLPVAYAEDGSNGANLADDDGGLDEVKQFLEPPRQNALGRPSIGDCFDPNHTGFAPGPSLTAGAGAPPDDGFFDPRAAFMGALRDKNDPWIEGEWLLWSNR